MASDEELDNMQQEMTDVLASVLAKYENSMITKWIALVEVVTLEDGERGLWQLASEQTKAWDIKGMLHQALDQETAKTLVSFIENPD